MQIQYFVNAMILLKGKDTTVLCDPWVTFNAHSLSGLYNFPELAMTKEEVAAIKPDYIYITHTHADHFDPVTLSLFPKTTPVIVSHYEDNFTEKNIKKLGFHDVRISDPENGIKLNGNDRCWLEPSEVYPDVDSIGIFNIDNKVIVNANDNPYHEGHCKRIKERFNSIDVALVPFSAQGPYPAFYENIANEEKTTLAKKKKEKAYNGMINYINTLEPHVAIPFAAGAIYGGKKARLSPYYGVGDQIEAVEKLGQATHAKAISLSSQGIYDVDARKVIGPYRHKTYQTEQAYIEKIAEKPTPFDKGGTFYIAPSEQIDLTRLLKKAREKQSLWQKKKNLEYLNSVFLLDAGQEMLYRLCLADTSVTLVREKDITDPAYEIFRLPYSLLIGLLTAHYNYSNVKTQFLSFYRKPDVFNAELHILMSYLQL